MKGFLLPLVSLLILSNALPAAEVTGNIGPKSIPELQTAIEAILKDTRTPGAAIAIVSRNQVEWVAGIGKADLAANQPVTTNTLFRLGSISKTFAAIAALQLQEAGRLKLSDTVKQWVPEVAFVNPWESTHPLRLVHLLEQTSGFDDMHLRELALNDPTPVSLKDALAMTSPAGSAAGRPAHGCLTAVPPRACWPPLLKKRRANVLKITCRNTSSNRCTWTAPVISTPRPWNSD